MLCLYGFSVDCNKLEYCDFLFYIITLVESGCRYGMMVLPVCVVGDFGLYIGFLWVCCVGV